MGTLMDLKSLLGRGYFPIELPPLFTTENFAEYINKNPASLENFQSYKEATRLIFHDIPRYGLYRRTLGIPNPISYANLAKHIVDHWQELKEYAERSPYSFSKPVEDKIRCIVPAKPIGGYVPEIMHTRANARFILRTDISQYFASIYTHSIPWAIHGKDVAKQQKQDKSLIGNQLDKFVSRNNHNQTIGIPIGPDISLLIGEIILAAVDEEINKFNPNLRGYRYIDDYEFSFKTFDEASEVLTHIKRALKNFELEINERKTMILELPVLLEEIWVSELRSFNIEGEKSKATNHKKQRVDLIRYFDKSFQLVKKHPNEHVLNYSVQRLRGIDVHKDNWELVQHFLLQCMMIETGTIRSALFIFNEYSKPQKQRYDLNKKDLGDVLNYQVWQQSRNGYLNEIAWAIWAMIYWKIPMESKAADEVSKIEDSFVALLTLDAREQNLISHRIDTSQWEKRLVLDELNGSQWLLSYEAQLKGWLSGSNGNYVSSHDVFKELQKHSVSFYDADSIANLIEHSKTDYR